MDYYVLIKKKLEKQILLGRKRFILFPFGEQGMLTKRILNEAFGVQEVCIVDNWLSQFNPNIKKFSQLSEDMYTQSIVLITSNNEDIYKELREEVKRYIDDDKIVDLFERQEKSDNEESESIKCKTKVGKYSYGPLCDHWLVESVGAFCSINYSVDVVENHAINYISSHIFLYPGSRMKYDEHKGQPYYMEGISPKGEPYKAKKVIIGNDVWLGQNVIITNGAKIGNGVVAGAGAVITKDVPDYAVVGGVPARIIRYRYTSEQIQKLNKIAWWNWPDEKIRKCYDDFFDDIDTFIKKHEVR